MCALDPLLTAAPLIPHVTTQLVEGFRTMSKAILIAVAALAVTGCMRYAPEDREGVTTTGGRTLPPMTAVAPAQGHGLYKVCDGKRLVYVSYAFQKAGGIAIVENAPECARG